jgi:hypothetical protein
MKKVILSSVIGLVLVSSFSFGKSVEQTICFSQKDIGAFPGSSTRRMYMAVLGDNSTLNGGQCQGKTLPQMNKLGWRLIQVVGGLDSGFGMVFEKK